MNLFWSFIISLIIIIICHELGHFFAAKYVKCKVETVSLGFGKPLCKKKIGETTYQICPILLGGYCKLKDEVVASKYEDAFTNLRYRNKFILAIAGCVVNIIMGYPIFLLGDKYNLMYLYYFGYLSLWLGITNLVPFPALDGSYPILVWLEKLYGKEKGYRLMDKIVTVGFWIIMTLNVISLGYLAWLFRYDIFDYFYRVKFFIMNLLIWFIS